MREVTGRMSGGSNRHALAWGLLLFLVMVQVALFLPGIRQSADDAGTTMLYLEGWKATWAQGVGVAHEHGRIGMYVLAPINAFAAFWSAQPWAQAGFIALHFLVMGMFSRWAAFWFGRNTGFFLAVVLVAVHPLTFEHMPPNAYPLQNTVPFLLLLCARVWSLHLAARASPADHGLSRWLARGLFFLGLLFNEYALVFGSSLVAMEMWLSLRGLAWLGGKGVAWRQMWQRHGDCIVALMLALFVYLAYRWLHPSHYDGNVPDGVTHLSRWARTTFGHMLAGTMLVRLDSSALRLPLAGWIVGLLFACAAGLAARGTRWQADGRKPGVTDVAFALLLAIFVVMPVTSTLKQQNWCVDHRVCGFLDSRVAYLWIVLACVLALGMAARAVWGRISPNMLARVTALGVAAAAFITFGYNWRISGQMAAASEPWRRADALACDLAPLSPVRGRIDPQNVVVMHPDVDPEAYWKRYTALQGKRRGCLDVSAP